MDPVVHFEIPYNERERMVKFYTAAFGWDMHLYGEDMGNYVVAHTTETDEQGMIQKKGAINGGFFPKKAEGSAQYPSVVIAVEDMLVAIEKVKGAGGEVLGEPMMIPGVGLYVGFVDTEGNRASLLQPLSR